MLNWNRGNDDCFLANLEPKVRNHRRSTNFCSCRVYFLTPVISICEKVSHKLEMLIFSPY